LSIESAWQVFLAGTAGGCLLELLHWYGLRQNGKLPDYARSPFYWAVTIVMALAGGGLAWLYFGDKADAVVALHVGLSTPLILQKLTTTVAQTPGGKGGGPSLLKFFEW
jgi:hypothetical protein